MTLENEWESVLVNEVEETPIEEKDDDDDDDDFPVWIIVIIVMAVVLILLGIVFLSCKFMCSDQEELMQGAVPEA